jgi:hypothetical protein
VHGGNAVHIILAILFVAACFYFKRAMGFLVVAPVVGVTFGTIVWLVSLLFNTKLFNLDAFLFFSGVSIGIAMILVFLDSR